MSMERRKRKQEDREKSISKEQKKYQEELQVAGRQYVEENRKLQKVIKDKTVGAEITVVQALVEVVTSNWEDGISSKESEKHSQRKARSD